MGFAGASRVLAKWLKSKSVPKNSGDKDAEANFSGMRLIKIYELELSNMEDAPSYSLTHQLTIGSEIGNIIIADPSVSPRHATFILQQEVVSIIDHGSLAGTKVNGKKIPPGRYIILEESDAIQIGDLEVKVISRNEKIEDEGVIPPTPAGYESEEINQIEEPSEKDDNEEESLDVDKLLEQEEDTAPAEKDYFAFLKKMKFGSKKKAAPIPYSSNKKSKSQGVQISLKSISSANSLARVIAVVMDFLLAYALIIILGPFDEFRDFLQFIPSTIQELAGGEIEELWRIITTDYAVVGEILTEVYQLLAAAIPLLSLLIIFFVNRLVTTLILGVSLSEFLIAIRPTGNIIWARLGGMIRVTIGMLTGPFLIFDLPAIVSKRTFKELVTFTNLEISSKFFSILGVIFFLPLYLAMVLLAPLIQGFDPPEAIMVLDKIDQRMRVAKPTRAEGEAAANQDAPVEQVPTLVTYGSQSLNLKLQVNPAEVSVIPDFKFSGGLNKLSFKPQLSFVFKELQRPVSLELFKNFDMKQLLGLGIKGNFFLYDQYPEIYTFVYTADTGIPTKSATDAKAQAKFANEVINFMKVSLELTAENAFELMQTSTPLIKGLIDFKAALKELVEYKDFDQVGFIKAGNVTFLKISFEKQKPFDLIIPLTKGEGRIFKVEFDKKENLNVITNKFYKYALEKSDWLQAGEEPVADTLGPLQTIDLMYGDIKKITPDKAQSLYGYYFEFSAKTLSSGDLLEYEAIKKSVSSLLKILDSLKKSETEDGPISKLHQNMRDLSDALENKNSEYFGVKNTTII
jgi:pSer/pThr/pTyr-binding forkhead associated (FHA) protein